MFCTSTNTLNFTRCTVANRTVLLTSDLLYTSNLTIVLDNSTVACDSKFPTCNINLRFNGARSGLILRNKSLITGRQVVIDANSSQLTISDSSQISASGLSTLTSGTQLLGRGASYIGQGGSCNQSLPESGFTYGSFDTVPQSDLTVLTNQAGSIGLVGNMETAGGGRIVINVESLNLNGTGAQIQANAKPYSNSTTNSSLPGGSGGYIYIATSNLVNNNTISNSSMIQANGGFGTRSAFGGSGGIIVLDSNFTLNQSQILQFSVAGGNTVSNTSLNVNGCGNGATGSIFFVKQSLLVVDSRNTSTTQKTVLTLPVSSNKTIVPKLATKVILSNVTIRIQSNSSSQVLLQNFESQDNVTIQFNTTNPLTLFIGENCTLSQQTVLDLSLIRNVTINSKNQTFAFGAIVYGLNLQFNASDISFYSTVQQVTGANQTNASITISSDSLNLKSNSSLMATYLQLHATGPITTEAGFNLTSYAQNSCNINQNAKLFSCVPADSISNEISELSFIQNYNSMFGANQTSLSSVLKAITNNFTIYVVSFEKINMTGSYLTAPRIGFCAPEIGIYNSKVDTNGKGCTSGQGLGKGQVALGCAGSGGAHGGQGGYGIDYYDNMTDYCVNLAPKSNFSQNEAKYEGSGGASGVANKTFGGSGGGIIHLNSIGTIYVVDSIFSAKGGNGLPSQTGLYGSGGGAGGSLQVITKNIAGNGTVDLSGGDGAQPGGGGGSGGRLGTSFFQSFNASNMINRSASWNGTINLEGGKGGFKNYDSNVNNTNFTSNSTLIQTQNVSYNATKPSNITSNVTTNTTNPSNTSTTNTTKASNTTTNTTKASNTTSNSTTPVKKLMNTLMKGGDGGSGSTTQMKCFGGFTGPFCSACEVGTFKFDYGIGVCQPCTNKPVSSFYNQTAQSSLRCSYQCNDGLENADVNPLCLDSFELNINRFGSTKGLLIIGATFAAFTAYLWLFIAIHGRCTLNRKDQLQSKLFETLEITNSKKQEFKRVQDQMIEKGMLHMRESEVWGHTHRMYLIGDGSISNPWRIPKDFPNNALHPTAKDRFLQFIKNESWTLEWTYCEKFIYFLLRVTMPYLADWNHRRIRARHFQSISHALYDTFDAEFWEDQTIRQMRLTADTQDCQLAYFDFIDQKITLKDYVAPQLPMTLLLAGNGTLQTPYRLNFEEDVVAKSLIHLHKSRMSKVLLIFFQNLNSLLEKLCFYKFNRQTMRDLNEIIELVEIGNQLIFNPIESKITLYLFENKYTMGEGGNVVQRRRSIPLDFDVLSEQKEMYKNLIRFVQLKLLNKKSEIRFGLVIQTTHTVEKQNLTDRINQALKGKLGGSGSLQQKKEYDLLDRLSQKRKKQDEESPQNLLKEVLLPESKLLDSEVMIFGQQKSSTIKIFDKSIRAFDISPSSTEALVIALKKDRRSCKNSCTRFKSIFYSTWLLVFKANGKPAGRCANPIWNLLFSLTLTWEILLTVAFLCHIGSPVRNWTTFGIPFVLILPGLVFIAPLYGVLAVMMGSAPMLKTYSTMNVCMMMFNYPLTLAVMIYLRQQGFYIGMLVLLMLNKILLSVFGAKVRQFLQNPGFSRNEDKLAFALEDLKASIAIENAQVAAGSKYARLMEKSLSEKVMKVVKKKKTEVVSVENESMNFEQNAVGDGEDDFGLATSRKVQSGQPISRKDEKPIIQPFKTTEVSINRGFSKNNSTVKQMETENDYQTAGEETFVNNKAANKFANEIWPRNNMSSSHFQTDEENFDGDTSNDEDFGIIATSKLKLSSLPNSNQKKGVSSLPLSNQKKNNQYYNDDY